MSALTRAISPDRTTMTPPDRPVDPGIPRPGISPAPPWYQAVISIFDRFSSAMETAGMGVATIALLGPVAINGDPAAHAPRDRVVLSALALKPTEVSSIERLADALWGSTPPPSWPKVVPGCIHRLRRALGAGSIETTPYGYRLTIDGDEIDTRRFEHLLKRGRELLTLGDAERAAYTLGEAVGLWRGGAYLDLDDWEPGRIEASRLAELRLEAQDSRIDAACARAGTARCWRRRRPPWPKRRCGSSAGGCWPSPSTAAVGRARRWRPCARAPSGRRRTRPGPRARPGRARVGHPAPGPVAAHRGRRIGGRRMPVSRLGRL